MIATLFIIAGLVLLVAGADLVVRGASWLATSLGIKPIVLGITVVAVGTSVPELVVGITASLQGSGSLAVGNIAGTNLFNILFILGISAALQPLPLEMKNLQLELPMIVLSAALMTGMALDGTLSPLDGLILFTAGVLYTIALIRISRKETRATRQKFKDVYGVAETAQEHKSPGRGRIWYSTILVAGIGLSVLGAGWLVHGAVDIARMMGVSEAIIGLTIVAVGTSAPELVTTIVSTLKGARDIAVGNLIGSSVYNILFILGITCLISTDGIPVARELILIDIPLMACVALACVPVFISGRRISRLEGGVAVFLYLAYMLWLVLTRT